MMMKTKSISVTFVFILLLTSCFTPYRAKNMFIEMQRESFHGTAEFIIDTLNIPPDSIPVFKKRAIEDARREINHFQDLAQKTNTILSVWCSKDSSEIEIDFKGHGINRLKEAFLYANKTLPIKFYVDTFFDSVFFKMEVPVWTVRDSGYVLLRSEANSRSFYPTASTPYFNTSMKTDIVAEYTRNNVPGKDPYLVDTFKIKYQYLPRPLANTFSWKIFLRSASNWLFIFAVIGAVASILTIFGFFKKKKK